MKSSNFDYLDKKLTLNCLDLLKNMCSYTCCICIFFLLRCACCERWGGTWFIYFCFVSLVSYQGVFWELLSLGWKESLCLTKEKTSRTKFRVCMLVNGSSHQKIEDKKTGAAVFEVVKSRGWLVAIIMLYLTFPVAQQ